MATLTVSDGSKIRYWDHMGEKHPVVLIHGWAQDHTSWDPQVAALTQAGHRVVSYDRRGFGASAHSETGYDYKTLATDLHQLLDRLDLHDVTLVGFSMGGGEIAEYLHRFSRERVRSVVFISSTTPYLLKTEDNPEGGFPEDALNEFVAAINTDKEAFFEQFLRTFYSAQGELKVTQETLAEAMGTMRQASHTAIVECAHAWARSDFRGHLRAIGRPTLVVHGDSDAAVPVEVSGQRTHAAIEESTLHLLTNGPHGVLASHAEEVADLLVKWVSEH